MKGNIISIIFLFLYNVTEYTDNNNNKWSK